MPNFPTQKNPGIDFFQTPKNPSVIPVTYYPEYPPGAIKQMENVTACTIELQMHLGGLLSTQEARVTQGDNLRILPPVYICNSIVHAGGILTSVVYQQ